MSLAYSALRTAPPMRPTGGLHCPVPRAHPARHGDPLTPAPRVRVVGSAGWTDPATVRVALTRAWREAGRPIVVVHDGGPFGVDAVARAWVVEHAVCGVTAELAINDQADVVLTFPAPAPRPTGDRL